MSKVQVKAGVTVRKMNLIVRMGQSCDIGVKDNLGGASGYMQSGCSRGLFDYVLLTEYEHCTNDLAAG